MIIRVIIIGPRVCQLDTAYAAYPVLYILISLQHPASFLFVQSAPAETVLTYNLVNPL